jgi:DNA-binding NarL/FixJ family response regulator
MVIDQDPVLIASYLRENVKGYLSEKSCNSELVACINLVLSGKKYISFDMIDKLMKRGNKTVHSNKRPKLTFKQYEIAKYLAKGISIEVIAKKLGKNPASIIASKAHIYNVLKVSDPINLNTLISTVSLTR